MAIPAVNGTNSTGAVAGEAQTLTQSHTVGSSLTDSILVAMITNIQGDNITSATWNGDAMTRAGTFANVFFKDIFYIRNPDSGTHDFVGSWDIFSRGLAVSLITVTGVKGVAGVINSSGYSSSATLTVTTVNSDALVLATTASATTTHTQTGSQVQQTNFTVDNGVGYVSRHSTLSLDCATAGAQALSVTLGTTVDEAMMGISLESIASFIPYSSIL